MNPHFFLAQMNRRLWNEPTIKMAWRAQNDGIGRRGAKTGPYSRDVFVGKLFWTLDIIMAIVLLIQLFPVVYSLFSGFFPPIF